MRISDWSSDVCSSDLRPPAFAGATAMFPALFDDRRDCVGGGDGAADPQEGQRQRGEPQAAHVAAEARVEAPARERLAAQMIPVPFGRARDRKREREQHDQRSEEHTSELQSLMRISYAVFCL